MDVREKQSSEKRLIDYHYLEEKIECPGVPIVYWDDIEAAPTVDAVEVVRCSECKYRTEHSNCGHPRHEVLPPVYPNDFCSYGERREG